MAEYRKHEILSGLFLMLAVLVFALFAFKLGSFDLSGLFGADSWPFKVYVQDVKTLAEGAKVTVGGRSVGVVQRIDLVSDQEARPDGRRIRVTFDVTDPALQLDPGTAEASLIQSSFLGTHFVSLTLGDWNPGQAPPPLEDRPPGGEAVEVRAGPLVGLDAFLENSSELSRKLDSILVHVDELLVAFKREIGDDGRFLLLRNLNEGIADARSLIGDMKELLRPGNPEGIHQKLIDPSNALLANLDGQVTDLSARVRGTLDRVDGLLDDSKPLIANLDGGLTDARELLAELKPRLTATLDQASQALVELRAALDALEAEAVPLLASLRGTAQEARPAIADMLHRMRRIMWDAEVLVRKVRANPSVLLWGDSEPLYDPGDSDATDRRAASRVGPLGQRDEP
jgi:ABC-type transporter Mla subunit MlaD